MDDAAEEMALIGKLAVDWHLNVPERRRLPGGRAKASLLLDAIERTILASGGYPTGLTPDDDFHGGLITLTSQGDCRILWKNQVSFSQYEANWSTKSQSPREAAETFLRSLFGAEIDGMPIDWQV